MNYPDSLACNLIDRKHDQWQASYAYWEALRKLAEGGQTMTESAPQFLMQRSIEPEDVYRDRLARFRYANHLGNIKGWYTSALFKQPPKILLRTMSDQGAVLVDESDDPRVKQKKDSLLEFFKDCDRGGHNIVDFWSEFVEPKLLTYRVAYVLFDLPPRPAGILSLLAQRQSGALRPHLVAYAPQDVINWQVDEQGNLLWLIIKLRAKTQDNFTDRVQLADRWYVFDREEVAVYEYIIPTEQQPSFAPVLTESKGLTGVLSSEQYGSNAKATLLDGYPRPHALADQSRVPVFVQALHADHWIGQRVAGPLMGLINLENSHDWAMEQANLATLTVYSRKELGKIPRGEAHYLQLDPEDRVEFTEPSGQTLEQSAKRIVEVREEVYRLAYLVSQGRSASAAASVQSGYSKEMDMMPARDVLAGIGDQVRGAIEQVLQAAADRMGLGLEVDVQGFDFLDRADATELDMIDKGTSRPINSPTFQREVDKRLVRIVLPDANRETLEQIDEEIKRNPTAGEQEAQRAEQTQSRMLGQAARLMSPDLFAAQGATEEEAA